MFHLTVAFLPFLLLGLGIAIAAVLLTGLGLLLAALAGGTSVALLVKDKSLKRLLLLGAAALAIAGLCGCRRIGNKYGRVGATLLFAFAAAAAVLFGVIVVAVGVG